MEAISAAAALEGMFANTFEVNYKRGSHGSETGNLILLPRQRKISIFSKN